MSTLEQQISERRREISAKNFSMSIGELTSMYDDGDLIINPDFQRLFRWDDEQKTRLIESILLGIPIPSFFMATTSDGRWEVVDGLQRISTLLQLQGRLVLPDGKLASPLVLEGTKYLPDLEGKTWSGDGGEALLPAQKRDIKTSRIDVVIIDRQSDTATKYDLFQRLNSFGSPLVAQELRQALVVSENPRISKWIERLAENQDFVGTLDLSDTQLDQGYDRELVLRFVGLHNRDLSDGLKIKDLTSFLDETALQLGDKSSEELDQIEDAFSRTFSFFCSETGRDTFPAWNSARTWKTRKFSIMAFEVLALGVGFAFANGRIPNKSAAELVNELWSGRDVEKSASGKSAEARMRKTIPFGRKLVVGVG